MQSLKISSFSIKINSKKEFTSRVNSISEEFKYNEPLFWIHSGKVKNKVCISNSQTKIEISKKGELKEGNIEAKSCIVKIDISQYIHIKIAPYLKVDKDTIWVTPEMYEKLKIMSNTKWTIN